MTERNDDTEQIYIFLYNTNCLKYGHYILASKDRFIIVYRGDT